MASLKKPARKKTKAAAKPVVAKKKSGRAASAKRRVAVDTTAVRAGRFLPKRRRNVPASARRPATERIGPILEQLDDAYPVAECALNHENPLQLLVATILSAQCTDERVNIVTRDLFRRYQTAADFARADPAELEQAIRPTGFFRNKTKSLIGMGKALVERHGGDVPRTMEELLQVPGAARKTANVVLGTAYGIAVGVVVDTHVSRVSQRLGLTRHEDPVRIEADLMKLLPQDRWIRYSHQIIHHGRRICAARKPLCEICPLSELCPSAEMAVGNAEDV
jgi:endonuclease-3